MDLERRERAKRRRMKEKKQGCSDTFGEEQWGMRSQRPSSTAMREEGRERRHLRKMGNEGNENEISYKSIQIDKEGERGQENA